MNGPLIGIIGGSGIGELLLQEAGSAERVALQTPFGGPSSEIVRVQWENVDVAFLARHGPGHVLAPSQVPFRANVWALKQLGVSAVIGTGATGSLREDIRPGDLVLCDQVIDKTFRREGTFFDCGLAVHVEFADPFCSVLRSVLQRAAAGLAATDRPEWRSRRVHDGGTYVCMEGPQFSTRAESHLHRQWGGDLIGMTCLPEAKLAREAEMCYALVALPTDYDCWRPVDASAAQEQLLGEILRNLQSASQAAWSLIRAALPRVRESLRSPACRCRDALRLAIWSDKSRVDPAVRQRLGLLLDRYWADE